MSFRRRVQDLESRDGDDRDLHLPPGVIDGDYEETTTNRGRSGLLSHWSNTLDGYVAGSGRTRSHFYVGRVRYHTIMLYIASVGCRPEGRLLIRAC